MVCEKNEGVAHDFLRDPIPLYRDDDLIKARGTTLGADNGIGVALALAVLASPDIAHGPLEVLVTTGEEIGMLGAIALPPRSLKARYLLNLDGESDERVTIGCAGGADTVARRALSLAPAGRGSPFRVKVSGLKGGHSGDDIVSDRGNAIRMLAQILHALRKDFAFELAEVQGGTSRNAIAREASALVLLDEADEGAFRQALALQQEAWRAVLGRFEPLFALSLARLEGAVAALGGAAKIAVMSEADLRATLGALMTVPHGMETRNPDLPELARSSTNLAIVRTRDGAVEMELLTRSDEEHAKMALADRIGVALELAGFEYALENVYPGWKPRPDSYLARSVDAVRKELFGSSMRLEAVHAGLECGIIGEKHPGMEMVAIGPTMGDVHTPGEWASISSAAGFWKLLRSLLGRLS